jgi:hypothetical protein
LPNQFPLTFAGRFGLQLSCQTSDAIHYTAETVLVEKINVPQAEISTAGVIIAVKT